MRASELVNNCSQNGILARLALLCTLRLEAESKKASEALLEKLSAGASDQSASFSSQQAVLAGADQTLAGLEIRNDLAIRETLLYFLNLIHPDALYEAPVADPDAFLHSTPCFQDNKRKLLIALTELEKNKVGIIGARESLKTLYGKDGQELQSLFTAALAPVSRRHAIQPGSRSFQGKQQKQRASDITSRKPLGKERR